MVLEAHGGVCRGAVCAVSLRTEPGSARASRRGRRSELSLEAWLGSGRWRETAVGRVFQGEGTALSMEPEGRGRGGSGGGGQGGKAEPALLRGLHLFLRVEGGATEGSSGVTGSDVLVFFAPQSSYFFSLFCK